MVTSGPNAIAKLNANLENDGGISNIISRLKNAPDVLLVLGSRVKSISTVGKIGQNTEA